MHKRNTASSLQIRRAARVGKVKKSLDINIFPNLNLSLNFHNGLHEEVAGPGQNALSGSEGSQAVALAASDPVGRSFLNRTMTVRPQENETLAYRTESHKKAPTLSPERSGYKGDRIRLPHSYSTKRSHNNATTIRNNKSQLSFIALYKSAGMDSYKRKKLTPANKNCGGIPASGAVSKRREISEAFINQVSRNERQQD